LIENREHAVVANLELVAVRLSELQLRLFFLVETLVVLEERVGLLLRLLRLLSGRVVAKSQRQQELLEVFVLGVRLL